MKTSALIFVFVVATGCGHLFMRAGAMSSGRLAASNLWSAAGWLVLLLNWKVIVGLTLWVLSSFIYLLILSQVELSFVFCLGSLNYLFVPLISQWLFNEDMPPIRIAGMILIFTGVLITLYGKYIEAARA